MKERALFLHLQGYLPRDLCNLFGFSQKSLRRWEQNFYEHGGVVPLSSYCQGRPRKLNNDQISDLMDQLFVQPGMYLEEIQSWVAIHHEVGILKSRMAKLIEGVGFSYKSLHKAAAERDEDEHAVIIWDEGIFHGNKIKVKSVVSELDETEERAQGTVCRKRHLCCLGSS